MPARNEVMAFRAPTALGLAQARSFGVSLVDCQLLAKRQILKDEAPAAGESQVE